MSKERELLEKRLAEYNDDTSCMTFATHRHLKEQLAQLPREPLSNDSIEGVYVLFNFDNYYECFEMGVKWAEKEHGIGDRDE